MSKKVLDEKIVKKKEEAAKVGFQLFFWFSYILEIFTRLLDQHSLGFLFFTHCCCCFINLQFYANRVDLGLFNSMSFLRFTPPPPRLLWRPPKGFLPNLRRMWTPWIGGGGGLLGFTSVRKILVKYRYFSRICRECQSFFEPK